MRTIVRSAFTPILRAWVASKAGELRGIPRPSDARTVYSFGANSDRVLLIGDGPAVGWGVTTHELALPGFLARALSERTGRGAEVQVCPVPSLKASSAAAKLSRLPLERFDAIVIALGANDAAAFTQIGSWTNSIGRTLKVARDGGGAKTPILILGVHPVRSIPIYGSFLGSFVDQHARLMNAATGSHCASLSGVSYVPLGAPGSLLPDRIHDTSAYRGWADQIAEPLALEVDKARSVPMQATQEDVPATVAIASPVAVATAATRILDDPNPAKFTRIVEHARSVFGVRFATFSLVSGDQLVHRIQIGETLPSLDLTESFTLSVIAGRDGLILPDAAADHRFAALPHVAGDPHIRFYAGFPIEAPNGERFGSLNLFDPAPRANATTHELALLRHLGITLQKEVHKVLS